MGTETGRMLAGRYLLGARLGRGGMGTVWQATDQMLDREVAVKELSVGHLADEDLQIVQSRMKQEARAAARIKHPCVITIHDVLEQDGKPWIVMELIAGRSLAELVEQEGTLEPREAARIGAQVLGALDRGHQAGVIHRDVKPANVLLERGTGRVVLTDFGIATFVGDSALTRTGDLVGSPDYLAPERVHGGRPGPESDLWALGATLYAAVEGESPFRRESPLTTLAAVVTDPLPEPRKAGPLSPVLRALMAKEPQERPTAADVLRMLESVAAGHTTNITLGPSPLRSPTQAVPAVDRHHDEGWTPTVLAAAMEEAAASAQDGRTRGDGGGDTSVEAAAGRTSGASGGAGKDTAGDGSGSGSSSGTGAGAGAAGGLPTGPTARVPAQGGYVPASASSSPRLVTGPLYAEQQSAQQLPQQGQGQGSLGGVPQAQPHYAEPVAAQQTGVTRPPAPRRRRRVWPWLVIAALIAGAAGGGAAYWFNRHHGSTTKDPNNNTPSASSSPQPSQSPSDQTTVGPGYTLVSDPDGHFSFGLPSGNPNQQWVRDASGGLGKINYSPDNGEHVIRFGVSLGSTVTAEAKAKSLIAQIKQHDRSYKQLGFGPNLYKGTQGAQLEFTFIDAKTGELRHCMEQFYKAPNGNEYDIFIAYPDTDWNTGYARFQEVLLTFTVPGAQ